MTGDRIEGKGDKGKGQGKGGHTRERGTYSNSNGKGKGDIQQFESWNIKKHYVPLCGLYVPLCGLHELPHPRRRPRTAGVALERTSMG